MFKHLIFFIYTNGSCNLYSLKKGVATSFFLKKDRFKQTTYTKKLSKNYHINSFLKHLKKNGF